MSDLFEILHEDDDLLVINKPADLVCHPTKGDERSSLAGRTSTRNVRCISLTGWIGKLAA